MSIDLLSATALAPVNSNAVAASGPSRDANAFGAAIERATQRHRRDDQRPADSSPRSSTPARSDAAKSAPGTSASVEADPARLGRTEADPADASLESADSATATDTDSAATDATGAATETTAPTETDTATTVELGDAALTAAAVVAAALLGESQPTVAAETPVDGALAEGAVDGSIAATSAAPSAELHGTATPPAAATTDRPAATPAAAAPQSAEPTGLVAAAPNENGTDPLAAVVDGLAPEAAPADAEAETDADSTTSSAHGTGAALATEGAASSSGATPGTVSGAAASGTAASGTAAAGAVDASTSAALASTDSLTPQVQATTQPLAPRVEAFQAPAPTAEVSRELEARLAAEGPNGVKILGAARLLRGGPGAPSALTINLDPAALGKIRVELSVHEGQVAVNLMAEKAQAVQAIGNQMTQLRNALEAEGLHLSNLGVDLSNQGHQGGSDRTHQGARSTETNSLGLRGQTDSTAADSSSKAASPRPIDADALVDVDL